jgi:hypothetical protein
MDVHKEAIVIAVLNPSGLRYRMALSATAT